MQKYGGKEGKTTKNKRKRQEKSIFFFIKNIYLKCGRGEEAEDAEVPECTFQHLHAL